MTNIEVFEFFKDKREESCELTLKLIEGGFKQEKGGYIAIAKIAKIDNPSQWWHLMNYCLIQFAKNKENEPFKHSVQCGELYFWMAEVSGCVDKGELEEVKNTILLEKLSRTEGNRLIMKVCWDKLVAFFE